MSQYMHAFLAATVAGVVIWSPLQADEPSSPKAASFECSELISSKAKSACLDKLLSEKAAEPRKPTATDQKP